MKPYALFADVHFHKWNTFSTINEDGLNSRFAGLLTEVRRGAAEVSKRGGNLLIFAGDLFHVRGSVSPSVLNPVMDMFKALTYEGFEIVILAGNHDLEGKNSDRIGSAVTALEGVGCAVINDSVDAWVDFDVAETKIMCLPWHESIDDLKKEKIGRAHV